GPDGKSSGSASAPFAAISRRTMKVSCAAVFIQRTIVVIIVCVFPFLTAGAAHRDPIHTHRRLADANRHALTVLAAGADPGIEAQIVADHCDAMKVGRSVADQHGALQRRAKLAVLDAVGLGALE